VKIGEPGRRNLSIGKWKKKTCEKGKKERPTVLRGGICLGKKLDFSRKLGGGGGVVIGRKLDGHLVHKKEARFGAEIWKGKNIRAQVK